MEYIEMVLCNSKDSVIIVRDAYYEVTIRSDAKFYPCDRVATD